MKLKIKPNKLLSDYFKKFPVPAVFSVLLTLYCIIHDTYLDRIITDHATGIYRDISSALWMALFLSTAATLLCRHRALPRLIPCFAGILGLVVGFLSSSDENMLFGVLLFSLFICLHFVAGKVAPAIRLGQVCGWFFVSLGVSIVLYLALALCISVFFSLLAQDAAYDVEWAFNSAAAYASFLFFAPALFLGGLPDQSTSTDTHGNFRKFARLVLLPLYLILLCVLLLYVAKITVTLTMPIGVMNGYAILALSLFVFFHLLLTEDDGKLPALFLRYGGFLLLPIIAAQCAGIVIRISAYGTTANRILGIVWSLLCLGVVIYSLLRRRAHWFFPAAALTALVILCSPLNAETIARLDQESRLSAALKRNNMLSAQGDILPNEQADAKDQAIIYSAADYLVRISAPQNSLAHTIQSQIARINLEKGYYEDSSYGKAILFGFGRPVIEEDWFARWYTFTGNAQEDRLDTRGYAYAKFVNLNLPNQTEKSDAGSVSTDIDALVQSLTNARGDKNGIQLDLPVTAIIDGASADLAPLLQGLVFNEEQMQLTNDLLTLSDGKQLHIAQIQIYDYANPSYDDGITLRGWLLTPEN